MPAFAHNTTAVLLVLGIVAGMRLMNSPRTAVKGNLLGSFCLLAAIILTLTRHGLMTRGTLWASMAVGASLGAALAARAQMVHMPQLVALFNGLGGGASAAVGLIVLLQASGGVDLFGRLGSALALSVGGATLSGSLVAAGKLAQRLPQPPIRLRGHTALTMACLSGNVVLLVLALFPGPGAGSAVAFLMLLAALCFGILLAIRVGGADMPITISLLNSLSGLAASVAGLALRNPLLVAVGAIVGAAGLILTQAMCRAMNRSVLAVLAGSTTQAQQMSLDRARTETPAAPAAPEHKLSPEFILETARKVVIVPGYGMALAQAQYQVKALFEALEHNGKEVTFAIHPVAGRMPGHMHVLLAEVDIPYDRLCEIDDVNPEFPETDLVLIVGANDVVNPAAATAEGTPIYGMPVLDVGSAKHVVVCNLDDKPGFAGVPNPLYTHQGVVCLWGDAKQTLDDLVTYLGGH